jgi:hypothetical protein
MIKNKYELIGQCMSDIASIINCSTALMMTLEMLLKLDDLTPHERAVTTASLENIERAIETMTVGLLRSRAEGGQRVASSEQRVVTGDPTCKPD